MLVGALSLREEVGTQTTHSSGFARLLLFAVGGLLFVSPAQAADSSVIVQSMFGGQIFGFDIDQAGNEGILAESQTLADGRFHAAVETFDQTTGAILKVVKETQSHDDFITWGIVGHSVGLVEREHEVSFLNIVRSYLVLDPLRRNRVTGKWTPPLGTVHMLSNISRNQGVDNVAVYAQDTNSTFRPFIFSSNIAANTFGPVITLTDDDFVNTLPALAYDSALNRAVLGAPQLGNPSFPVESPRSIWRQAFSRSSPAWVMAT